MNFTPKYTLTPHLLNNLSEIERQYGRLEGVRIPQHLLLNLERTNLIQSSYVSNSIEGNPLSLPEVTNLLVGGRIPTNRDEKEVKNYFTLLQKLEEMTSLPLAVQTIENIHAQLLHGVDDKIAGHIRNKEVIVGGFIVDKGHPQLTIKHKPPFHTQKEIKKALAETIEWLNIEPNTQVILKAGIFHHQYVYIHPFEDGNGRTCRLLTALVLLKHHYQINKYFVLDDYYDVDRDAYSDALHTADTGDKTTWLEYFTDGIKYSLQSALARIESGLQQTTMDMRLAPREQEALDVIKKYREIKSSDLVDELKVSRQQVFNILKALIKKGYIEKKGSTKSSYYHIK